MPRVLYAIDIPKPTSILMFQCPECLIVWSWFEGTMCQTGCGSSKEDLMYDHFGPEIGNLQPTFTLPTGYMFTTWKARNPQRISRRIQVKYQSDGSALHVYWQADTDYVSVEKKLPQMGGWLRHELSQLQNGRVPHINFIFDTSNYKATDVEDLLKFADFGPDHISPHPTSVGETFSSTNRNEMKTNEKLAKSYNVLGIDRNAIISQVSRSMNHVPKVTSIEHQTTNSYSFDNQRRVDLKKIPSGSGNLES
ncbi:hypothetical protein OUZ56_024204 [Daphnia magna]|uniref:Uncharacterized protein n=1 Tax=Daphnia magna TaxID=35525 RepID=A0ABR0B0B4_9CRUS|nr:hypothetical protein OUZ56_024204 [Daphnia magna]